MKYGDIKGLDVQKGLALIANNKAIYVKLLKSFASNAFCDKLIEAINGGDAEQIRQAAHAFKGVAGNMHMDELFELSRAIEADVKSGAQVKAGDEKALAIVQANGVTMDSVNMLIENPGLLDGLA